MSATVQRYEGVTDLGEAARLVDEGFCPSSMNHSR